MTPKPQPAPRNARTLEHNCFKYKQARFPLASLLVESAALETARLAASTSKQCLLVHNDQVLRLG